MLDSTGKKIKKLDKQSIMVSGMNSMSINKEDMAKARYLTFGDALLEVFSRKIKPANFSDAADMKKWHSRFYNRTLTEKGSIELDKDELKEIKEILDTKADPAQIEVIIDGEVYKLITDYLDKVLL